MTTRNKRFVAAPVSSKSSARVIRSNAKSTVANVAPVTVAPVVIDIAAKRSEIAKRAVATRRANIQKKIEADKRLANEKRLSEIATRAAATRRANRENGIAPNSKSSVAALSPSLAATKANMTRTLAKHAASTDPTERAALAVKIEAYRVKMSTPAPLVVTIETAPDAATIEVARQNFFYRMLAFIS